MPAIGLSPIGDSSVFLARSVTVTSAAIQPRASRRCSALMRVSPLAPA